MIHDALVTDLAPAAGRLPIVSFEDHILRRFGAADILRLSGGEAVRALRASADEVWVLVEGAAHFLLEDTRPDSPTYGLRPHIQASRPTRLLLPFGVRLEVRADPEALLVRVMSHSEREDPPLAEAS
jgi:hypothetical protein